MQLLAGFLFESYCLILHIKQRVQVNVGQVLSKGVAMVESLVKFFEVSGQHNEVKRHFEIKLLQLGFKFVHRWKYFCFQVPLQSNNNITKVAVKHQSFMAHIRGRLIVDYVKGRALPVCKLDECLDISVLAADLEAVD